MSVMMVSEVNGQSAQGYDGMLALLDDALRKASGFVMHMAHAVDDGWRVVEVWNSREDATRFFAAHVAPNLPEGIRPKLCFQSLHSLRSRDMENTMTADELTALIRRSEEANAALLRGDVDRYRASITITEDYSLMSPFGGPPTHGPQMSDERWEAMKRFFRNGTLRQELVQFYASPDMVVLATIEHVHGEVGGLPAQDWSLRVTQVYRRVGTDWWLAHRHADPLAPGVSVAQAAALARGTPVDLAWPPQEGVTAEVVPSADKPVPAVAAASSASGIKPEAGQGPLLGPKADL